MKSTLYSATTVVFFLLLVGCDSNGDSSEDDGVKYSILYEAGGTFTEPCSFIYITQVNNAGRVMTEPDTLPWTHSFELTLAPERSFDLYVSASCSGGTSSDEAEVNLFVDGVEFGTETETGQIANLTVEYTLTADE